MSVENLFHSPQSVLPGDLTTGYLQKEPNKVVALLGGGMDGFLALHSALVRWPSIKEVTALFFNYNQVSKPAEIEAVRRQMALLSKRFHIPTNLVELFDPLSAYIKSPLTQPSFLKEAHGEADPEDDDDPTDFANLEIYIPNRNARFMTQAFGYCDAKNHDMVTFGAVGNVNLDNSVAFLRAAQRMHEMSGSSRVGIYAPFALFSKSMVIEYAAETGLVAGLGFNTVSCFFPKLDVIPNAPPRKILHCGKCRSCLTMLQGFRFAGVEHDFDIATEKVSK